MFCRNQWWGYIHTQSGDLHLKRYFSRQDIDDAYTSQFCSDVRGPVDTATREEASKKLYPEFHPQAAHA